MNPEQKKILLDTATAHVRDTSILLDKGIKEIQDLIDMKVGAAKVEDRWMNESVKRMSHERLSQLIKMKGSPYFSKCECTFEGKKTFYFGRFTFPEAGIYSWVAPIASIRFDVPGKTSCTLPSGVIRTGTLHEKDDYQITDGKILFYSTESETLPRTLIHQEYFSQKRGFMLPEIVSQMEKAQDRIIRAPHKNPLVISGPAGSGKTTLALHRVAYLLQAPLTTDLYLNSHITVFVQDQRSKEYFSHLLPELGITTVTIQTYNEWAIKTLGLDTQATVISFDSDYMYEQAKIAALREAVKKGLPNFSKSVFSVLDKIYTIDSFKRQKELNVLDRIDLTLLLMLYINNKKRKSVLEYNLIVIDEFQNYLPEQLSLLKSCINTDTKSTIYVGDIAQQINPGALRNWSEIQEHIPEDRYVLLKKVYRNTKCILDYIRTLGYEVLIPEGIKQGIPVEHISFSEIKNKIPKDGTIGILGIHEKDLEQIRKDIQPNENIHIITVREAQGLEFDIVVLLGFDPENYFEQYKKMPESLQQEKQKIDRDLLYIGLTRAIKELYIC